MPRPDQLEVDNEPIGNPFYVGVLPLMMGSQFNRDMAIYYLPLLRQRQSKPAADTQNLHK